MPMKTSRYFISKAPIVVSESVLLANVANKASKNGESTVVEPPMTLTMLGSHIRLGTWSQEEDCLIGTVLWGLRRTIASRVVGDGTVRL